MQWLRDGLGIIASASQSGDLASKSDPAQRVYLVPAFVGLGAPYWEPHARGAVFGVTRATTAAEMARAALESVCYQTRDLTEAMRRDWTPTGDMVLRVDGGMVASDWTMQCLADILDAPVDRPTVLETTAMGAAWLAGQHSGVLPGMDGFSELWKLNTRFTPKIDAGERESRYADWKRAVRSAIAFAKD